jgi:hypothetical protein
MTSLLTFLNTIQPLSPELSDAILAGTVRQELPAHHCLVRPGEVARQVYFLESGLVRGYTLLHGREISSWFVQAGDAGPAFAHAHRGRALRAAAAQLSHGFSAGSGAAHCLASGHGARNSEPAAE